MRPTRVFAVAIVFALVVLVLSPVMYMFVSPFLEGGESFNKALDVFESRQISLARSSFILATGSTLIAFLLGLPLAFLVERTDLAGRKIFVALAVIPLLIPPYIHAIIWNHLNPLLIGQGLPDIHSLWGAIFVLGLAFFPFIMILTISGLKSVDRNQEEAGLLTHGKWQVLGRITLPLVKPHILSGMIFVFVFALVDFGVPDIFRVKVYPVEIFIQFSAFYDERAAMVLSLPLIGLAVLLVLFQKWNMSNRIYVQTSGGATLRHRLGLLQVPAFGFCACLLFLSVGLPLVILVKMAGPLATYIKVLGSSYRQVTYSLVLAGGGALAAMLLSFALSYIIERTRVWGRRVIEFLIYIPLAFPAVSLGIGLIKIWNRPGQEAISSWTSRPISH